MTGEQYGRALKEHWRVVVAAVLVGLLLAGVALFLLPKKYSASVDAFVLPAGAATDASAAYQGGLLSEQRVKSYVQLFEGGRVAELVVARLGLPETPGQLTKAISVSAQTDTVILSISVVDPSPERALLIANTAADAFRSLVSQLEQPPDPRLPAATSIKIVAPARLADAPVSPQPTLYLAAGGFLGLLAGVVLAVRRDARGRPVRSAGEVHEILGVPGLGVMLERSSKSEGLAALDHGSPDAEAFRQVRTGLQFADVDHRHKLVVVTSALEGEGKTTTACNLAAVLTAAGHSVLLVDADLRQRGATRLLGIEESVGLSTVLMGRIPVAEAVQTHAAGFRVLGSGPQPPNPSELAASESMATALRSLREAYEYVLVDSAPLLPVTDTASLAGIVDGTVLVCRYASTRDSDLRAAASTLEIVRASLWGTVLTMVPRRVAGSRTYGSYQGSSGAPALAVPAPGRRAPESVAPPSDGPRPAPRPTASHARPVDRPAAPAGVPVTATAGPAVNGRPAPGPADAGDDDRTTTLRASNGARHSPSTERPGGRHG